MHSSCCTRFAKREIVSIDVFRQSVLYLHFHLQILNSSLLIQLFAVCGVQGMKGLLPLSCIQEGNVDTATGKFFDMALMLSLTVLGRNM